MNWNVTPEYISLVFVSILLVYSRKYSASIPTLKNKLFQTCLCYVFFEIIISIISIIDIENYQSLPKIANQMIQTVFYLASPFTAVLFLYYLIAVILDDDSKAFTFFRIAAIPYGLYAALVLTNPLTGLLFDIGEPNGFTYGNGYLLVFALPLLYILAMMIIILIRHRKIERSLKFVLLAFPAMSFLIIGIQWVFPSIILSGSAATSGLMIVFLYLQSKQIALSESLKVSVQKYKNLLDGTVAAFSSAMEMRDPYTCGHQKRVSRLAKDIAVKLGISWEDIETIQMAGLLHDIGKIQVPAEILAKPGKLTPLEFSIIKVHSEAGRDILKSIDFAGPIAEIVYQHHEKMDGSGYPRQLKGEQILLAARIICVADVVEAMVSDKPYRPALSLDVALAEIERGAGIEYDINCVNACIKLFRDEGYKI
jgi:putative nucleotidyltransferase with HDIG domain